MSPQPTDELEEPRWHLEAAYEELQERYLAAIGPERISVRRAGLVALLRTVDSGGFWSGDLGITYPAGAVEPVADNDPRVADHAALRAALARPAEEERG